MFSWEYLKDRIDLCTLFISGREIAFTQALPITLPQKVFEVFKKRDLLWPDFYEQVNKSRLRNLNLS